MLFKTQVVSARSRTDFVGGTEDAILTRYEAEVERVDRLLGIKAPTCPGFDEGAGSDNKK
jgi:hypothetical protein